MAEGELNLLDRRLAVAGEFRKGASRVVQGRVPAELAGVGGDHVGNSVRRYPCRNRLPIRRRRVHQPAAFPEKAERETVRQTGRTRPAIDERFALL